MFSFGLVQNFEPFSRPFRGTVEKSYLVQFDVELSQLFKTVRDLKIGHTLMHHQLIAKIHLFYHF